MNILLISADPEIARIISGTLTSGIKPEPRIRLCGIWDARKQIAAGKPDVVILNIDQGLESDPADYIISLAPRYYVSIIVVTERTGINYTLVSAGALDVINLKRDEAGLKRSLKMLQNSVVTNAGAVRGGGTAVPKGSEIIAIGGSTGSTLALPVILKDLRPDCPPVLCVLHMPEGYTEIYARQLNSSLNLEVMEAKTGHYPKPGQVIIAAGAKHLRVFKDRRGYFINSEAGVRVGGHCPSVNVLFDSVAYAAKNNAIGVILTGMGSDGRDGMLNMKRMGAYNIAQDEASSVVYGMPKEAADAGAVSCQCPLDKIAEKINQRVMMMRRKAGGE